MGLHGVELIMAIEEEFKISISDAEASQSDTVGKVVDIVPRFEAGTGEIGSWLARGERKRRPE